MAQTYTTEGIILKRKDYQENDRLFFVFTKEHGKLQVVAKGTKKISSKLNSYLEPMYLVRLMIAKGKGFDKLANCNLLESYQNLREDQSLLGFYLLSYIAEVNEGLIEGQTFEQKKFELLEQVLGILNHQVSNGYKKLLLITNVYFLKLLSLLGYQPEIQRCLECNKGILLTKNIFDFSQGGIICEECKKVCLIEDYLIISDGVIKILQLAKEKELDFFINLQVRAEDDKQFDQVVNRLLLVNLERSIKSYQYINRIKK